MDSRKSYKLGKRPVFYSSEEHYCGIIPWVAIHAIDWMKWLSGENYVSADAAHSSRMNGGNGTMDITSAALFRMTNDVIATVTADSTDQCPRKPTATTASESSGQTESSR